jgi:hypothetical protein
MHLPFWEQQFLSTCAKPVKDRAVLDRKRHCSAAGGARQPVKSKAHDCRLGSAQFQCAAAAARFRWRVERRTKMLPGVRSSAESCPPDEAGEALRRRPARGDLPFTALAALAAAAACSAASGVGMRVTYIKQAGKRRQWRRPGQPHAALAQQARGSTAAAVHAKALQPRGQPPCRAACAASAASPCGTASPGVLCSRKAGPCGKATAGTLGGSLEPQNALSKRLGR